MKVINQFFLWLGLCAQALTCTTVQNFNTTCETLLKERYLARSFRLFMYPLHVKTHVLDTAKKLLEHDAIAPADKALILMRAEQFKE